MRTCAEPLGHLGLHELLDPPAQRLPDDVRIARAGGLFETGEQCDPLIDDRGGLLANVRHSLEDNAVTLAKGLDLHHDLGHWHDTWNGQRVASLLLYASEEGLVAVAETASSILRVARAVASVGPWRSAP